MMDLFRRKDNNNNKKGGEEKEIQQQKTSFKCSSCGMKFNDKDRLRRHTRKAHSKGDGDMPNPNPFSGF
jgi:uncharacterized Zn-finger protein